MRYSRHAIGGQVDMKAHYIGGAISVTALYVSQNVVVSFHDFIFHRSIQQRINALERMRTPRRKL